MVFAKFQDHGTSGFKEDCKGFGHTNVYGHGGNLAHLAKTIVMNLCPLPLSKETPLKIWL